MSEKTDAVAIRCTAIVKVHPRLVTILIRHSQLIHKEVAINLPIKPELYPRLLRVVSTRLYSENLPFVFIVRKGIAIDFMPATHYRKMQETKKLYDKQSEKNKNGTTKNGKGKH